jgi:hypothetical protein
LKILNVYTPSRLLVHRRLRRQRHVGKKNRMTVEVDIEVEVEVEIEIEIEI